MTRVAVCLLTCDRVDYTRRTLESFRQHNAGDDRFLLLHGDDASTSAENRELAAAAGFETILQTTERRGWLEARAQLFEAAAARASWIYFLENDIETLRGFPWPLFDFVRTQPEIYCLRLYGRFKDLDRQQACLATHKRRRHKPVQWRPFKFAPEASQIGEIHWSAQPAVTRTSDLLALHHTGDEPAGLTVRVKKNVVSHFGLQRTAPPAIVTAPLPVARLSTGVDEQQYLAFHCPGCGFLHSMPVNRADGQRPNWTWNGDLVKPTLEPSIRNRYTWGDETTERVCHGFVRAGRIEFLADCTHPLAGGTVDLRPMADGGTP